MGVLLKQELERVLHNFEQRAASEVGDLDIDAMLSIEEDLRREAGRLPEAHTPVHNGAAMDVDVNVGSK